MKKTRLGKTLMRRALKAILLLPFLLCAAWLLKMVYFPAFEAEKAIEAAMTPAEEQDVFNAILQQSDVAAGEHFHMIDAWVREKDPRPPLCATCHGTYPHGKEKKVRSMLNFHTGFVACSVCHSRIGPEQKNIHFTWIDRRTGDIRAQVQGAYGKYSAKIYPVEMTTGRPDHIFEPVDPKAAMQFLKVKDQYSPDQIAQAKIKLHEHISTKPVFCSDCHRQDGYLDFKKLGFPQQRINHLNSTEVVGMIEKYKTFYLPTEIDFGAHERRN